MEHCLDPDFFHATKLTLALAAVAVPLNTVFGVVAALLITRNDFPGKVLLLSLLDLPFSISPVVTGLMLTLLYGRSGWWASALAERGWNIVFAFPGEWLLCGLFCFCLCVLCFLRVVGRGLLKTQRTQNTHTSEHNIKTNKRNS